MVLFLLKYGLILAGVLYLCHRFLPASAKAYLKAKAKALLAKIKK